MTIIKDVGELDKAITAWGKRGKKWVEEGHTLAMSALTRLKEHGDIGPVNRLFVAMPKGSKTGAMGEWLLAFGALVPNEDKGSASSKPFVYTKDKQTDVEAGSKKPWYTFQPEATPLEMFDVQAATIKALQGIIKKAAGAATVQGAELLEKLTAMVGELEGVEINDEAQPVEQ